IFLSARIGGPKVRAPFVSKSAKKANWRLPLTLVEGRFVQRKAGSSTLPSHSPIRFSVAHRLPASISYSARDFDSHGRKSAASDRLCTPPIFFFTAGFLNI